MFFNEVGGIFPFSIENRDTERMWVRIDCSMNMDAAAMDVHKMIDDSVSIDVIPTAIGHDRFFLCDLGFAGIPSDVRIRNSVNTDRIENFVCGGVLHLYIPPTANPTVNTILYHYNSANTEHATIKTFTFDVGDGDTIGADHYYPLAPEVKRVSVYANYCTGMLIDTDSNSITPIINKIKETIKAYGIAHSASDLEAIPVIVRALLRADGIEDDIDLAKREHGNRRAYSHTETNQ